MNRISECLLNIIEKIKSSKTVQVMLIVAVVIVFGLTIYYNYYNPKDKTTISTNNISATDKYVYELECKVEDILLKIDGVKDCDVVITVENGFEYIYAEEEEINGDFKTTELVLVSGEPVVVKEIFPVIKGVVIVCDGCQDLNVRFNILQLLQTALKISNDKITILPA